MEKVVFTVKPFFKWLSIIIFGLALLSFVVIDIYSRNEKESNRHHISTCQLIQLSGALNKYYAETGTYPEVLDDRLLWGTVDAEFSGCGGELGRDGKLITDPWGDEIVFKELSEKRFAVYSENSKFTRLFLSEGSVVGVGENKD